MSLATKTAVVAAMKGDSQLVALLAADPNASGEPALFHGHKNQAPPVYNCLTYRIASGSPDPRYRPSPAAGGGASKIEDEILEIEAWSQKPDSADIESIAGRLDALFDGQPLTLSAGRVFRAERLLSQADLYDDTLDAHFGLFRYRLRISKG